MELETERLILRPLNENDYDDLYEIYSNESICKYLLIYPWEKEDKESFYIKTQNNYLGKDTTLNIAVQLNGKVIGDISVWYTDMKDTVEIGYVFNPLFHHNGYAKEALKAIIKELFCVYKVHRIQTNLDARNIASAKLCESIGMRKEAHFIQDYWNKGEWTDSIIYGMLESDLKD